jgi:lysyl-tRNA synthetase class I
MLAAYLGKPLTSVPDPFSNEYPSFGAANNARLRAFLDSFGFEYEFQSATDYYKSGKFDAMLLAMLRHYEEVQAVMLPTLGPERRATYSPFLPVSPKSGRVLQVRARSSIATRTARPSRRPLPAATSSCSGRPTGPAAGLRWVSTTRCTARISSPRPNSVRRS